MHVRAVKTRVFKEADDLAEFIVRAIPKLKNGSVLAVTSKIVALAECRTADPKDKEKLIKKESTWQLQAKWGKITLKDGILMWNAGIDTSNAAGKIVLLPKDSFKAAARICAQLKKHYRIKNLGILITDSRIMPLRAGVVGIALGYAGFKGLKDYRGKKDLFGEKYQVTRTDIADSLATAAVLEMGEGNEQTPIAVIEDVEDIAFNDVDYTQENPLIMDKERDIYAPLIKFVPWQKNR